VESKKVIDAIKKILTDLGKLDDQQLEQILDGSMEFKCESPKAGKAKRSSASGPLAEPVFDPVFEERKTALLACTSRAEATTYLTGLKMKVVDLKEFAKYLNLKVPASGKDAILKAIVDQTVGFRVDAQAVFRT
jgi:hypothetical protein